MLFRIPSCNLTRKSRYVYDIAFRKKCTPKIYFLKELLNPYCPYTLIDINSFILI